MGTHWQQKLKDRRQRRNRRTAEHFTPMSLVEKMLDKLPESAWEEGKTVLDPYCGNGNMLVPVLRRKLARGHDPLGALRTVFGADIMRDNVKETRLRLLKVVSERQEITADMVRAVFTNVVCTGRFPKGSLDYDFSFPPTKSEKAVAKWTASIRDMLAKVSGYSPVQDLAVSEREKPQGADAAPSR